MSENKLSNALLVFIVLLFLSILGVAGYGLYRTQPELVATIIPWLENNPTITIVPDSSPTIPIVGRNSQIYVSPTPMVTITDSAREKEIVMDLTQKLMVAIGASDFDYITTVIDIHIKDTVGFEMILGNFVTENLYYVTDGVYHGANPIITIDEMNAQAVLSLSEKTEQTKINFVKRPSGWMVERIFHE